MLKDEHHPDRPQHPDFWHLSEVILEMDGDFYEEPGDFEKYIASEIDLESLFYTATQRAIRLQGRSVGSIAAIYMEAVLVGMRYERRYGKKKSDKNGDEK